MFSADARAHETHLTAMLQALDGAELKAQKSKCEFGPSELHFLGHVVSADGIQMDPAKIQAMTDWPVPKNVTEVRAFWAF